MNWQPIFHPVVYIQQKQLSSQIPNLSSLCGSLCSTVDDEYVEFKVTRPEEQTCSPKSFEVTVHQLNLSLIWKRALQ